MSEVCCKHGCSNKRYNNTAFCIEHPPLVDHGLTPNETVCPKCENEGMGTIHDDLWYCLDDYGYTGCGEIYDPYELSDVDKERQWQPEEVKA